MSNKTAEEPTHLYALTDGRQRAPHVTELFLNGNRGYVISHDRFVRQTADHGESVTVTVEFLLSIERVRHELAALGILPKAIEQTIRNAPKLYM